MSIFSYLTTGGFTCLLTASFYQSLPSPLYLVSRSITVKSAKSAVATAPISYQPSDSIVGCRHAGAAKGDSWQ